jgi:hypothetical protein
MDFIVQKWSIKPKKVFLIDGLGALLSIFLLGFVLPRLDKFIGMPEQTLYLLASLPCLFVIYNLYSFFSKERSTSNLIKTIALANISYCTLSMVAVSYHFERLTYLGMAYFTMEIILILLLAIIELKIASVLKTKNSY